MAFESPSVDWSGSLPPKTPILQRGRSRSSATPSNKPTDESALESAHDDLQDAVQDLPEGTTAAEAIPALEPQLQAVNQSLQEISGGLNCAVSAETGATETG